MDDLRLPQVWAGDQVKEMSQGHRYHSYLHVRKGFQFITV